MAQLVQKLLACQLYLKDADVFFELSYRFLAERGRVRGRDFALNDSRV